MKFIRSKLITSLLAGALLLSATTATAEQISHPISVYYTPMHFVFDGKEQAPPEGQSGFIYEGSTYVPLRFISYALNKGVEWDPNTYTVSVLEPSVQQKVEILEYRLNREVRESSPSAGPVVVPDPTQINVYFEKIQYIFDDKQKQPSDDLPGMIYENSLYVPMRFFSESIGKKIDWDPVTYTVSADTLDLTKPDGTKPSTKPPVTPPITGAGGITKPSYESLQASFEGSVNALKNDAIDYFTDLFLNSLSADAKTKAVLKSQAEAKLSEFDARFESLLSDFGSKLQANGYGSDLSGYRQQYADAKAAARASIGQ